MDYLAPLNISGLTFLELDREGRLLLLLFCIIVTSLPVLDIGENIIKLQEIPVFVLLTNWVSVMLIAIIYCTVKTSTSKIRIYNPSLPLLKATKMIHFSSERSCIFSLLLQGNFHLNMTYIVQVLTEQIFDQAIISLPIKLLPRSLTKEGKLYPNTLLIFLNQKTGALQKSFIPLQWQKNFQSQIF